MKTKKTGSLPGFKVYQRTKKDPIKIAGRLESSKIQLKITASPDDWNTLINLSFCKKEELLRDLRRFMFEVRETKINKKKIRQNYINLIKTQAALLHGYISYGLKDKAYCKPLEDSLKIIIPPEQFEDFIITKGKKKNKICYDAKEIARYIIESVYSYGMEQLKINISDLDNFENTYIYGGKKRLSIENISQALFYVKEVLSYGNENNPHIEFLQDISEAALIVMNHVKSSKTLSLQKGIIKAAFPSFSTHPKS